MVASTSEQKHPLCMQEASLPIDETICQLQYGEAYSKAGPIHIIDKTKLFAEAERLGRIPATVVEPQTSHSTASQAV
jgi:hypothetical protein